ncbi:RDD family protein [Listeria costaricensis]|uniref:RDD family protein n=1 Tax=Listeria costaricensis TaxID=2026604 RepID=UPI000C076B31|nr:RDD family protein [Listeria costaricensis]
MEQSIEKNRPVYHYEKKQAPFESLDKVYCAGFWLRFLAYLVDLLTASALTGILIRPIFRLLHHPVNGGIFSLYGALTALLFIAYFILMTKRFNQTLGKMLFGLKVIRADKKPLTWGNVFFREGIWRFIQKIVWPLYLVVAFTPKKQGIHDLFEQTTVVHESFLQKNQDWEEAL